MAQDTPHFLFRVYSDESQGKNSLSLFSPSRVVDSSNPACAGLHYKPAFGSFKAQLQKALSGQHVPANPFIFFTRSMLCAVQRAIYLWRTSNPENLMIACIDTRTATNANQAASGHLTFRSAANLMEKHQIKIHDRWQKKARDYQDVWITTTPLTTGQGSREARFCTLLAAGLLHLYPELAVGPAGFERPLSKLRQFWAEIEDDFQGPSEIPAAVRLAQCFQPPGQTTRLKPPEIQPHICAFLLSIKSRKWPAANVKLEQWLRANARRTATAAVSDNDHDNGDDIPFPTKIPEVDQYIRMRPLFVSRSIPAAALLKSSRIPAVRVEKRQMRYKAWRKQHRTSSKV